MEILPKQHIINLLLDKHHSKRAELYCISITYLTSKQCLKIKKSVINTNNWLNEVFLSFDSLNKEISPGFHLINILFKHFSFI